MSDNSYYKIRNKVTGKYSTGGTTPTFSIYGKMWKLHHLNSHLRILGKRKVGYYHDCEIVKYELQEVATEDMFERIFEEEL